MPSQSPLPRAATERDESAAAETSRMPVTAGESASKDAPTSVPTASNRRPPSNTRKKVDATGEPKRKKVDVNEPVMSMMDMRNLLDGKPHAALVMIHVRARLVLLGVRRRRACVFLFSWCMVFIGPTHT